MIQPTQARAEVNAWDLCHNMVTKGLGIDGLPSAEFAEPDLQQQWIIGTPVQHALAFARACDKPMDSGTRLPNSSPYTCRTRTDGIPAGGRDDRAGLPDSAGGGGWRSGADGAALDGGMRGCNNAVRDRSSNRENVARQSPPGKPEAAEPFRPEPPCVSAGGTGQR